MTKNVRIENADTAPYEIAIDVTEERLAESFLDEVTQEVTSTETLVEPAPEPVPEG